MSQSAFAPAKINLFLHVGPLEASGYHPVASLAVFADVGDRVSVSAAEAFELVVDGPFAPGLAGAGRNLVLDAIRGLEAETGLPLGPVRVLLEKALPVAAGVGGGTADAAATLRLFNTAFDLGLSLETLERIAAGLGSDGPLCLQSAPAIAEGRGERLSPAPDLPDLHAVLVNPREPCATGAVYAAFDAAGSARPVDLPPMPDAFESAAELAAFLALTRNDLERPAVLVQPAAGAVLARLHAAPQTLIARMSGSGATSFALVEGEMEAESLSADIARENPAWWVKPCRLGGPWPGC
ncbi:MAG TPA: 4-(cytidine 5'-diphospho)-2-C-methyl-D-erythritol kinase [Caulobacteraceae bacterium]